MPVCVDISTISSSVVNILEFKSCEKHSLLKAILEVLIVSIPNLCPFSYFHAGIQKIFVRGGPSQKTLRVFFFFWGGGGGLFCLF